MEDGAGKTALAMAIFGRSGADLIPMLNAGRDGLAQMTEEANRFGLTISTQTSKAAEGFNDNLTRISSVLTGLGNKIAERSAPAMKDLTDRFIVFVNQGNYVERIANAIGSAMDALAQAVQWASSAWEVFAIRINAGIAVLGYLTNLDLSGAMDAWSSSSVAAGKVWERNAQVLAQLRGEIQSVNSELKTDLEQPKAKAPMLPSDGTAGAADEFSVAPSQEPGTAFADRLAMIKDQFATEREILAEEYTLNQETLDGALANKLLSEQEYYDLSRKLAEDHATSLASIQSQRLDGDLTAASSFFGSMAQVAQAGGKRLLKVAKAAAAAQAIVDTIRAAVNAMNDPTAITPIQKFANYAAVFAKGMSAVAAIKGVSEGGGGGGGGGGGSGGRRGGGGGASAAPAAASPTTTFQFTMMNDPMGFGEKFARQFIDQLNSTQRNGGTIRGVIA
jgi:hypothetical protein